MFYNLLLLIYFFISIPKTLLDLVLYKKNKPDLLKRFGLKKYSFDLKSKNPVIWIHAVSVGETKAAASLVLKLKREYLNSYILISSVTQAGHEEAKKTLSSADDFIFFPFDFSFTMKKVFSNIKPNLIIIMETDIWYNFIKEGKKAGAKIVLVSAKISEKSYRRFSKILFFSKKLFSYFDLILTQNDLYKSRFENFIAKSKIQTFGNLKLVNFPEVYSQNFLENLKNKINKNNEKLITIASTHHPEEEMIIEKLKDLPNIKILLAPRHIERSRFVLNQLLKITSCCLLSNDAAIDNSKVIIIDKMGLLNSFYQISDLAVVGGSFVNRVGGHNILEPVFVNKVVIFGPFMHSQTELEKIVLDNKCGFKTDIDNLKDKVHELLTDKSLQFEMIGNCRIIKDSFTDILNNTFDVFKNFI
ncbi:MAG: glycosyltransferase N-terminal domain-containing protein [Parachlamydiales bacterium]|jgi:3-deoxy-D-manno-octulosonic-acid transferase